MKAAANQTPWTLEGGEKRSAVQRMFSEIAPTYDLLNGVMSFSLHHRWRAFAVRQLGLQQGDSVLDMCCGTGDFFRHLRPAVGARGRVLGMDFCEPMLRLARKKEAAELSLADACQIPLQSSSMDAVTVGWGIRNVPDVDKVHREIARVLKPGKRFVSVDMALPRNAFLKKAAQFVTNKMLPMLGRLFGKTEAYTYLPKSTQKFATREELKASMELAGLRDVQYRDLFFGNICVHWGTKP